MVSEDEWENYIIGTHKDIRFTKRNRNVEQRILMNCVRGLY